MVGFGGSEGRAVGSSPTRLTNFLLPRAEKVESAPNYCLSFFSVMWHCKT